MVSIEFLVTSLVVVLVPGTGVIYTVSNGLFAGSRAGVAAAMGCTAGILPHLLATVLGLTAILHMSSIAFQLIKYAGALYLFYLAWMMYRESGNVEFEIKKTEENLRQIVMRGILINILNPKLSLFFLAFLPLFISRDATSPTLEMMLLSGIFMTMTLVVFIVYGVLASQIRRYVEASPHFLKWLQRGFASLFAGLGARVAMIDQ